MSLVENGVIEVGDRPTDEVVEDFVTWGLALREGVRDDPADAMEEETHFNFVIDHRDGLRDEARAQHSANKVQISIILYATWIEHSINKLLLHAFAWQQLPDVIARTLIRSSNIDAKIGTLWDAAGLPAISPDVVRSIRRVTERRNAFVHYKWDPEPDEPGESRQDYIEALANCEDIVARIDVIEDTFYWSGRRSEVLAAFRTSAGNEN